MSTKKTRASHEVIEELVKFAYKAEETSPNIGEELGTPIDEVKEQLRADGIDPQRVISKLHQRLEQLTNRQNVARLRSILEEESGEEEPDIEIMRAQLPGILNNGAFAARNYDQMTDVDVVELWRIAHRAKRAGEQQ